MRNVNQTNTATAVPNQSRLPPFGMPPANLLSAVASSQSLSNQTSPLNRAASINTNMLLSGTNNSSIPPSSLSQSSLTQAFGGLLGGQQQQAKSNMFNNGPMLTSDNDFPTLGQVASSNPQSRSPMLFASMSSASMNSMYGLPPFKDSQRPPYAQLMKYDQSVYGSGQMTGGARGEEFHIANEDFPALTTNAGDSSGLVHMSQQQPSMNSQSLDGVFLNHSSSTTADLVKSGQMHQRQPQFGGDQMQQQHSIMGGGGSMGQTASILMQNGGQLHLQPATNRAAAIATTGIQTHSSGRVTNIPRGMLNDQFGMAGLLTFLRAIETDPGIVALALGHDLTTLGLNLNAQEKNLYQSFGGPWQDMPCRPQNIDVHIPEEYATNAVIKDKLPPIKLNRFHEDLLFYLFYNFPGELYQMAAASELYAREWRFHRDERIWVTRTPHYRPVEQSTLFERGEYYVFDASAWKKVQKTLALEYAKLEDRPPLPGHQGPVRIM